MADGDIVNNQIQTDTSIPNDKQTELNSEIKGKKPPPHAFSDYTQYRTLTNRRTKLITVIIYFIDFLMFFLF